MSGSHIISRAKDLWDIYILSQLYNRYEYSLIKLRSQVRTDRLGDFSVFRSNDMRMRNNIKEIAGIDENKLNIVLRVVKEFVRTILSDDINKIWTGSIWRSVT